MPYNNNRKTVTKTIYYTDCTGVKVSNETGELEDVHIQVYGRYTPSTATKKLRRECKDNSITIVNTDIYYNYYTMPLETFIKYADKLNKKGLNYV